MVYFPDSLHFVARDFISRICLRKFVEFASHLSIWKDVLAQTRLLCLLNMVLSKIDVLQDLKDMDQGILQSNKVRQLLRGVISNYLGGAVNLVIWFLLTPFILDQLGPTLYGLWLLIGSVVAYASLLDFGISGAITKYVAEYRAKQQYENAQHLLDTALVFYMVIGSVVAVASIIIAPHCPRIFNIPQENQVTAVWLVALFGLGTGLSIPSNSVIAVLRGLERFDLLNLIAVINIIMKSSAIVTVLLLGGSVLGIVIAGIAVDLFLLIPSIGFIHRAVPDLRFRMWRADRSMFRVLTSFGSSMFMLHIGGQLHARTDQIVIGTYLPVSSVTPYSLAGRLSSLPQMMTDKFLSLLLPLASKLHAENDHAGLRALYIVNTRLTLAVFLPIGVSLIFLAGPFLTVWVGKEFASYAYLVLILTLTSMIDTSTWPAGSVLQGMGLQKFSGRLSLISGLTNLLLSIVLVQRIGLAGVAVGALLPTTIICLGLVHPYVIRAIKLSLQEVFHQVVLAVLIPAVPSSIAIYILTKILPLDSIFSILLVSGVGFIIYMLAYLRIQSNSFERELIRNIFVNIFQQARSSLRSTERRNL
jgi:O-antigen/teichoic acid export membrane protein